MATRATKVVDSRVGHDPRSNGARTEGHQIHAKATSWTTTWIQSTTTALPIGKTTTAESKTDVTISTIRTECNGISGVELSWAITTTTGSTQACGEAYAET